MKKKRARRTQRRQTTGKTLSYTFEQAVKFSEVDSMSVLWHGHYVRYFEDGREAWGQHHGLTYLDVANAGFFIPIVSLSCEHFAPLEYGDTAVIETTFVDSPAAKIFFDYVIYRKRDRATVATGHTTQVFLERDNRTLYLAIPPFYETWKAQHLND